MANTNFSAGFQNLAIQSNTIAGAGNPIGTAETLLTWTGGSTPVLTNQTSLLSLIPPADMTTSGTFDGKLFRVRIVGEYACASGTFIPRLYFSNSATVVTGNRLAIGSTGPAASTKGNFMLQADLLWDSISTGISGYYQGFTAGSGGVTGITSATVVTNSQTAASFASIIFSASAQFSAGAANTVTVNEFSIERV